MEGQPAPVEPPQRCAHGRSGVTCWDCLTPESQAASVKAWDSLAAQLGFTVAPDEAKVGKVIEMRPRRTSGPRIVLTHTLFSQCVEMLYSERGRSSDD